MTLGKIYNPYLMKWESPSKFFQFMNIGDEMTEPNKPTEVESTSADDVLDEMEQSPDTEKAADPKEDDEDDDTVSDDTDDSNC